MKTDSVLIKHTIISLVMSGKYSSRTISFKVGKWCSWPFLCFSYLLLIYFNSFVTCNKFFLFLKGHFPATYVSLSNSSWNRVRKYSVGINNSPRSFLNSSLKKASRSCLLRFHRCSTLLRYSGASRNIRPLQEVKKYRRRLQKWPNFRENPENFAISLKNKVSGTKNKENLRGCFKSNLLLSA